MVESAGQTNVGYDPRLEVQGRGPLVVFVPGIDGTGRLFYRQLPHFLAAGFRVATYRLRDETSQMTTLVDDLGEVIEQARSRDSDPETAHEPRPVTLVAESFGGTLALSYALADPSAVGRLVILNSFPHFGPQFRLKLGVTALGLINWRAMAVVRRLTAFRLHSRHTHRAEIRRFLTLTDETTLHGYANRLRILMRYDVRDRLPSLAPPALLLASDRDHLVPSVEQARLMRDLIPTSDLRILEGHGHVCLIAPGINVAQMLLDWAPGAVD